MQRRAAQVRTPVREENNNIVIMHHPYYRTHPVANGGQGGHNRRPPRPPGGHQEVILHPALFGPPPRRPVPNLLPRYSAPPLLGPHGPGPGPGPPGHDPFIEEQVEVLAEKIEGLEGELRYAWRALDVLSQEYVKMWQRLEKMEGLLSEQQTVITQLIDLYSADSSSNGGLKSGLQSPSSLTGKSQACDENFYKALNAVHGQVISASQSIEDFASPEEIDEDDHSGKVVLPPHKQSHTSGKQGGFTEFLKGFEDTKKKQKKSKKLRRGSQGSESDFDAKSVTSSVRSSISANTVKSEEVGDFPLPGELSPRYDNATPPTPPTISQFPQKKKKSSTSPLTGVYKYLNLFPYKLLILDTKACL